MTLIEQDGLALLRILGAAPRDTGLTGQHLAEATGLDPDRINDALAVLIERGLARWNKTLGTAPFEFADAEITPRGRLEQQRSDTPSSAVETSASRDHAPPPWATAFASPIRLFISHSDSDVEIARRLVAALRAALNLPADAIRCTSVDGYRLPGGAHTEQQLRHEVNTTEAFIGILSDNSLRSLFVLFELGARWGVQKHLIPLLAPGFSVSRLKPPLDGLNALHVDQLPQLHQLVSDVAAVLKIPHPSPASYVAELNALCTTSPSPAEQPAQSARENAVSPESVQILEFLADDDDEGSDADDIAATIKIPRRRTQYFLDDLVARAFVHEQANAAGRPTRYSLTSAGRRHLFDLGRL